MDVQEDYMTKTITPEVNVSIEHEQQEPSIITIESRFGDITVDTNHAIYFPYGLLGMPDNLHFCLSDIPNERMQQFKLLQSLNDHGLSFVVLPLELDNQFIDANDMHEACKEVGVEPNNLIALSIASVHRTAELVNLSLNIRAPILIDAENQVAAQYVFRNSKYNVRHML